MNKESIGSVFFLFTILLSFSNFAFSEANHHTGAIYEQYSKYQKEIWEKVTEEEGNTQILIDSLHQYAESIQKYMDSTENKALSALLENDLWQIVILETQVNKPLPNELQHDHLERIEKNVNQFIADDKKHLKEVFSGVDIPENSYLKILYHIGMINLANTEMHGLEKKLPDNMKEHCDQLMKGPLFLENSNILQPDVSMPYLWNSSLLQTQKRAVTAIREYILQYHTTEIVLRRPEGEQFLEPAEIEKLSSEKNQFMYASYPLSDYPFLEKFLSSDNNEGEENGNFPPLGFKYGKKKGLGSG